MSERVEGIKIANLAEVIKKELKKQCQECQRYQEKEIEQAEKFLDMVIEILCGEDKQRIIDKRTQDLLKFSENAIKLLDAEERERENE